MVQLLELSLQRQGSFSCHIPRKIFRLTLEAWIAALLRWFSQTGNPPRDTLALSRGFRPPSGRLRNRALMIEEHVLTT